VIALDGGNGFQINTLATGGESDWSESLTCAAVDLSHAPARPIDIKAVLRQATLTPGTPDETNR
jgi:hypothetical protein